MIASRKKLRIEVSTGSITGEISDLEQTILMLLLNYFCKFEVYINWKLNIWEKSKKKIRKHEMNFP